MPKTETTLLSLKSDEIEQVGNLIPRLSTDLTVGGIAIRGLLDPDECERYIDNDFELQENPKLVNLFEKLAETITGSERGYRATKIEKFIWGHPWHLAWHSETPSLRLWSHLRGSAAFWLARAKSPNVPTDYRIPTKEVRRNSFGYPTFFEANPGDGLLFVDRGSPATGTSTFHKVEIGAA